MLDYKKSQNKDKLKSNAEKNQSSKSAISGFSKLRKGLGFKAIVSAKTY